MNERAAGDRRRGSALSGCSQSDDSLATSAAEASDAAVPQFALVMELAEHGSLAMLLPSQGRSVSWRHPLFRIAHGVVRALGVPPRAAGRDRARRSAAAERAAARRLRARAVRLRLRATARRHSRGLGGDVRHGRNDRAPADFLLHRARALRRAARTTCSRRHAEPRLCWRDGAADMYSLRHAVALLARPTLPMRATSWPSRARARTRRLSRRRPSAEAASSSPKSTHTCSCPLLTRCRASSSPSRVTASRSACRSARPRARRQRSPARSG